MNMLKLLTMADTVTLAGAAAGFVSILFSIQQEFVLAGICMLAAAVLDWADGRVARWQHKAHLFGKELDSLADTVSFGVAPAVFGYMYAGGIPALVTGIFFLACGLARLARFGIAKQHNHFEGIPITTNGVVFPALYFAGMPAALVPFIFAGMGLLMVSSIPIKKG